MNVADALNELRIMTECHCSDAVRGRNRHFPDCNAIYREEVETVARALHEVHDLIGEAQSWAITHPDVRPDGSIMPRTATVAAAKLSLALSRYDERPLSEPPGHVFHFTVTSQGDGMNWWGEPWSIDIYAWSLVDALRKAAELGMGAWRMPTEEDFKKTEQE